MQERLRVLLTFGIVVICTEGASTERRGATVVQQSNAFLVLFFFMLFRCFLMPPL